MKVLVCGSLVACCAGVLLGFAAKPAPGAAADRPGPEVVLPAEDSQPAASTDSSPAEATAFDLPSPPLSVRVGGRWILASVVAAQKADADAAVPAQTVVDASPAEDGAVAAQPASLAAGPAAAEANAATVTPAVAPGPDAAPGQPASFELLPVPLAANDAGQ